MATVSKSEDILGQKVDLCIADTLIKIGKSPSGFSAVSNIPLILGFSSQIGGGLATGAVFSLFLFKRKYYELIK